MNAIILVGGFGTRIKLVSNGLPKALMPVGELVYLDLLLDKKGLQHVLKRHHPKYWDGSIKKAQSFFKPGMTIGQIEGSIMSVLKQNRKRIISKGNMGMYQIEGVVDGVTYKLGINNGRIGQFYPMN